MAASFVLFGCGSSPTPIASLSDTRVYVTFQRSAGGYRVAVDLEFKGVGEKLGGSCPVVEATASVGGYKLPKLFAGGQRDCDWLGAEVDCVPGVCRSAEWEGTQLRDLSFPDDGTVTIEIADSRTTFRLIAASAAHLWADATVAEVVPSSSLPAHQATLILAPQPPFDTVVLPGPAPPDANAFILSSVDLEGPGVSVRQLSLTADGSVAVTVLLPFDQSIPHPTDGSLLSTLVYARPLVACEGPASCMFSATALLPPTPLIIP